MTVPRLWDRVEQGSELGSFVLEGTILRNFLVVMIKVAIDCHIYCSVPKEPSQWEV